MARDADAFNAFEAAGWNAKVAGYDEFFGGITIRVVEPLLDAAGVGPHRRMLDVATGPGYAAARAAERGASVVGIDVAPEMLALASTRHRDLDFRLGSAEELPFDAGSFDAVVGNFVLLHLGRPERAVAEFARVLGPRGRVALTVWDTPDRARLLGVFLDALAESGATPPADVPDGPPFFRFSDEQEFEQLLVGQSFKEVELTTIAFDHQVPSSDELWNGLLGGAVRISSMIQGQNESTQRHIRATFERIVQRYRVGDHLKLPVSVKLASGTKLTG